MSWEEETIQVIGDYFKSVGIKYIPKKEVDNCLVDFFNYQMKLINPVPRIILKSKEISSKRLTPKYSQALHEIEMKIKQGQELTYHQSKKVLDPLYTDDLLNDWVIHHLHLSTTKSKSGQRFYDRSDYLLFVAFSNNEAFLIDVKEHNEDYVFAKKEFLEIMDSNWPEVMQNYYWKDVIEVSPNLSDEEIGIMRKKGYTVGAYNVNGKVIRSPGIGISSNGLNIQVVRKADEVCRILHASSQQASNEENLKQVLSNKIGRSIEKLDLSIRMVNKWPYFVLYETNSNMIISED